VREDQKTPREGRGSHRNSRRTIGLLIESTAGRGRWYQSAVWAGVADAAQERDANLLCFAGGALRFSPFGEFEAQRNLLYSLVTRDTVDGLIISGSLGSYVAPEEFRGFCDRYHALPLVSIAVPLAGIPSVLVDNGKGMRDVVAHLIEAHGCRRIAFICGPRDNPEAVQRYRVYTDVLVKYGLSLDPDLVAPGDFFPPAGAAAIRLLLDERKVDLDAVVAANDNMALGALEALQERGVHVPGELAVVGFGDIEEAWAATPSLTTVRYPAFEQGKRAAEMLLALLSGKEIPKQVILPTELRVRESCGCPHPAVVQAEVGMATRTDRTLRIALASRGNILSEMVKAVADPSVGIASEQAERLLNAFYAELKGESPGTFLSALDEILRQVASNGGDVFAWQEAISALRRYTPPYIGDDQVLFRVEDLWQQARVMIGERAQRAQRHRRLQAEQRTATLDRMNQALVAASDVEELMTILAEGLPRLEIPSCFVSLYENPVVPTEWCRLILAYKEGRVELEAGERRFPSWQLVPGDMLSQDRPYNLVVEPLYFRENQLGIAVFEVGPREGMVYETLRGQLSSALWGSRLVQYLRSLYEASSSIISLQEPQGILQDIVDRACNAVGARWANVVLIDMKGRPRRLAIGGDRSSTISTSVLVGTAGLAVQVMQSNEPYLIEDMQDTVGRTNQQMIEAGVGAAGCFPLHLRGKSIGVMWVYYEKPHRFPAAEVDALRLYVNQAAIAYDNARRIKELEHLRQAAEKLAKVAEVHEVLQQIVQSAHEVLQADSAVIWPYDAARMVFLPVELVAEGVSAEVLEEFRENEPRPGGTAAIVIEKGYLAVTDVDDPAYAFLSPPGRGLREAIGITSFQGIALKVGGESLGVLYVNYKSPQVFDEEDKSTLETFAYHAALALKKARLLEQVRKVHDTARIVATVSVLEKLRGTLDAIAKGTQEALNCDAVTLYTYDQEKDVIGFPPAMAGVENRDEVLKFGSVARVSLIYNILRRDELYVAEDAPSDSIVGGPFVRREAIKSSVSIPLSVSDHIVGVMFVNYRTRHRFTDQEIADIKLFAHQATVAIRNAQLYEEATKRATYLQALYEAGTAVTSTLALDEILERIVEQARLITGRYGKQAHLIHLGLKEGNELRYKTWSPEPLPGSKEKTGVVDLEHDKPIGIMGRAVKTGWSQRASDATQDGDYLRYDPKTRSALAVPIKLGEDVIGVINVEHPDYNFFDEEDQHCLESLAAQAAIAIQNARQYEELKRTKGLVGARTALAWMGMASSTWRHTIDRHALTIREQVQLLRRYCERELSSSQNSKVSERIAMIERLTTQILEKPITPPLSTEAGLESASLSALVGERARQLWQNNPYKQTVLRLDLQLPDSATVQASPEWLRRAFDILVDNAVDAVAGHEVREITIGTRAAGRGAEIFVSDTGSGIPEEILAKIGMELIEKPEDARGLGMGLLMAQTIVQTYGGEIRVESPGPAGATMLIWLPLEA
jgi:DNA-binding LacI/PurR family transcriptional regulator/GAF domain-containing protein